MDQLMMFYERINRRRLTETHSERSFFASLQGAKMPSLEEMGVVNSEQGQSQLDPEKEKKLEEYALRRLKEMQDGRK